MRKFLIAGLFLVGCESKPKPPQLPPWIHQSHANGITYTSGVCSFSDKQGVSHDGIAVCGEDKSDPNMCRCMASLGMAAGAAEKPQSTE